MEHLRTRRREILQAQRQVYRNPANERIPLAEQAIDVLNQEQRRNFRPYLGKKFGAVCDELRPVLRNAVAHLNPETHLVADEVEDVTKCEEAMPVIRYISRVMLRHEMERVAEPRGAASP